MKYLHLILLLLAVGIEASAQAVDQEKALEFKTGYNFITPTRRTWHDSFFQVQYNHFISYQKRRDQPRIGLLLNPQFTLGGLYGPAEDKFYRLLQPGKASMIPALYITAPTRSRVELYAYADAGLKVFPLVGDENVFRFFTQWQTGVGGGLRFNPFLSVDAKFVRAGHDFADKDRNYFTTEFKPEAENQTDTSRVVNPYFNGVQATAKFYLSPLSKKQLRSSYVFVNWSGFYRSYRNESFWTAGVSYSPLYKVRKTPPYASPLPPDLEEEPAVEPQLTLTAVKHLGGYRGTFELSGLAASDEAFYAVADNRNYLYGLQLSGTNWQVIDSTEFKQADTDLEGIAFCDDALYFVDENTNNAYKMNITDKAPATSLIPAATTSGFSKEKAGWDQNAGLEGIAVDCQRKIVYFAKERDEPRIYKLDKGKITSFSKKLPKETDIADLYYFNNSLYVLERKKHRITRLNASGKPVQSYSFHHATAHDEQPMYGQNRSYGFAEALLITQDKIYVGMDPNTKKNSTAHNPLNSWFATKYSAIGTTAGGHPTVILVFDKPKGF